MWWGTAELMKDGQWSRWTCTAPLPTPTNPKPNKHLLQGVSASCRGRVGWRQGGHLGAEGRDWETRTASGFPQLEAMDHRRDGACAAVVGSLMPLLGPRLRRMRRCAALLLMAPAVVLRVWKRGWRLGGRVPGDVEGRTLPGPRQDTGATLLVWAALGAWREEVGSSWSRLHHVCLGSRNFHRWSPLDRPPLRGGGGAPIGPSSPCQGLHPTSSRKGRSPRVKE